MSGFEDETIKMPGGMKDEEMIEKLSLKDREPEMIDFSKPLKVKYSPISGLPAEFCEYSATFKKELPWLRENAPEVLSEQQLAGDEDAVGAVDEGEMSKRAKKNAVGAKVAKESDKEKKVRIVIAKIQRQSANL